MYEKSLKYKKWKMSALQLLTLISAIVILWQQRYENAFLMSLT